MNPREIYHRLAKKKFLDSYRQESRRNREKINLLQEEYINFQESIRDKRLQMETQILSYYRHSLKLSLLQQSYDKVIRELGHRYSSKIEQLDARQIEIDRRYQEITKPIINRYDRYTRQLQVERFRRNLPPNRRLPVVQVPDLSEEDLKRLETLIEQSGTEILPFSEFRSIVNLPDLQVYDLVDDGSDRYRYLVVSHDSVLYYPVSEGFEIPIRFYPTILNLETVDDFEVLYPTDEVGTFLSIQVIGNNREEFEVYHPGETDIDRRLYVPPGFDSENQYREFIRLVYLSREE